MGLLRKRSLWVPALGHFTNDFYSNLLPVMFPLLVASLGLTYGQTGLVVTMATATSSLTQPLFGYLTDRFQPRFLGLGGMLWAAVSMVLAAYAWNYQSLIALVVSAALGAAAFHPQGATASAAASGNRRGTGIAVFTLAGNTGFALGPLMGGIILAQTGLAGAMLLIIPALLVSPVLYRLTPSSPRKVDDPPTTPQISPRPKSILALVSLAMLVILRPWADLSLVNFLPLFLQTRDLPLALASQILFLLLIGRAAGGLLAGFWGDRFGFRPVLILSLLFATPVFYLFLQAQDPLLLAIPLGMLLGAALPISIVLAQELLPGRSALASGLALGSTFVAGGIGTAVTGALADRFGMLTAMQFLVPLPFLAAFFALGLPTSLGPKPKVGWELAE